MGAALRSLLRRRSWPPYRGPVVRCNRRYWRSKDASGIVPSTCELFASATGSGASACGSGVVKDVLTKLEAPEGCASEFPLGIVPVEGGRSAQGSSVDSHSCSCSFLTPVDKQLSSLLPRWSPPLPFHCSALLPAARFVLPVLPTAPASPFNLPPTAPLPLMMFMTLGMCFEVDGCE